MKPHKQTSESKALERNIELYVELQGKEYVVILPTKSGLHPVGRGKTAEAAWTNSLVYYGLK